jgi:peptide/nickel transport system ATP-binding protein
MHPDRQVCVTTDPALTPTATGQLAACHFPGELAQAVA